MYPGISIRYHTCPRLTDEVAEKLNDGDTDYLINTIGAGFGGSGNYFFEFVLTISDLPENHASVK